jgi:hypothetical protein
LPAAPVASPTPALALAAPLVVPSNDDDVDIVDVSSTSVSAVDELVSLPPVELGTDGSLSFLFSKHPVVQDVVARDDALVTLGSFGAKVLSLVRCLLALKSGHDVSAKGIISKKLRARGREVLVAEEGVAMDIEEEEEESRPRIKRSDKVAFARVSSNVF